MFAVLSFITHFQQDQNSENYNFSSISEWLLIYFAIFLTGTLAVEISQIKNVDVKISLKNKEDSEKSDEENRFRRKSESTF